MTVKGLDRINAKLAAAPIKARARIRKQIAGDAEELVGKIKRAAPKRTGNLRDSVRAYPPKKGIGAVIRVGGTLTTKKVRAGVKDRHGKAGKGLIDYAVLVEFGSRRQAARPFFFPTIRAYVPKLKRDARKALKQALKDST